MVTGTNIMPCRWLVESVKTRDVHIILVWGNKVKRYCFGNSRMGVRLVFAHCGRNKG
jgi:hypothetical protein